MQFDNDQRQVAEISRSVASLQCTSCGGTDVQRLSMVYQSGTTDIRTTTRGAATGVGFSSGGRLGFGTAATRHTTTGKQMSHLAQRAAPPEKKKAIGWIAIGALVLFLGSAFLGIAVALIAISICGYFAYAGFQYNSNVYPELRQKWEKGWMCHRCGEIFSH